MPEFFRSGSVRIHRSIEGNGHKIGMEDYPHQWTDTKTHSYSYDWLLQATGDVRQVVMGAWPLPCWPAGYYKYAGEFTPLGTPVALLTRTGGDYLASPCGYCGINIAKCQCGKNHGTEGQ